MIFKFRKFLPLVLVELYLAFTLVLLKFGPVNFNLHNEAYFWILILLYHFFFILGYSVATVQGKQYQLSYKYSNIIFYLILFFGSLSILITYKNLMIQLFRLIFFKISGVEYLSRLLFMLKGWVILNMMVRVNLGC